MGFTGCHTLGRDGVGEGDDVSSVGRILLIVNVMYCNCFCVRNKKNKKKDLTEVFVAANEFRFFLVWTVSRIWGSGQMEVGLVCLGIGVSLCG